MKRLLIFAAVVLSGFALSVVSANAQASKSVLKEARVTQVVKDVKLLAGQAEPRPATLSDNVRGDTAVRTGVDSRAELTFSDLTIARLGANTIFSFNDGTRTVDLGNGAILLRVPKGSGGAKVQTAAVTAAITGTTVIVEYHPRSYAKYLVLEGTMRLYLKGILGESVLMTAGQMMILNPNARRLSEPVDFDLERLMKTSLFIQGYRPLGSEPLMTDVQQTQLEKKSTGELIDTNLVIFGRGTLVTLTDPQSLDTIDLKTVVTATPAPTPSKIGRPPVIANSTGYRVTAASTIRTDPAIANPARTDFGKIYRGPGADGNFSIWSFDATRPFDTSSGFDTFYSGAGVPVAAFKFQSLVLAGDPAISTANGGASFLELIGVDGITSGTPGGALTFAGINNLLLATQNGSIILGPEISFQNIPTLFFYARGAGSNINLSSPVSGVRDLFLDAEGSVQVNGAENVINFRVITGSDFLAGTGTVNAPTINISAQGNVNFTLSQFAVGGATGGTVTLNAGNAVNIDARGDQTVFSNADLVSVTGQTINFLGNNPTPINFSATGFANFTAGAGGFQASTVAFNGGSMNITSAADINLFGAQGARNLVAAGAIRANSSVGAVRVTAGTLVNVGGTLNAPTVLAGQSITTGADLISTGQVTAGTFIDVSGKIDANIVTAGTSIRTTGDFTAATSAAAGTTINVGGTFRAPTAAAGGDISANQITLLNVTTPGVLRAGGGGITPFIPANPANLLHSLTVSSIVSAGGIDFSGDNFVAAGDGKDGGMLSIFANTITFDAANIASANFNGASGVPTNSVGGSGGNLTITTSGAITANAPIQATTGLNPTGVAFGGTGGTVSFTSTAGPVNVNSSILVSSNDPNGQAPPPPLRRSAAGGILSLNSGLTTGSAITLGAGAQLFSLLNGAAPGPAGQIIISSAGGDIIDNGAAIEADRGTITIQHTAAASVGSAQITLNGGTITSETLLASSRGDLTVGTTTPVNVFAVTLSLLANGNLTSNGGTLTATATASSGNVIFQAGNDLSITGGADIERFNGGITTGLNLTVNAGRNLQAAAGFTLRTDGSGLTSGGNIVVQSGGTMTGGGIWMLETGPGTGDQGSGSNITLTSAGAITVADLFGTVVIGAGRTLGNGGSIFLTGAGSYTVTGVDAGLNLQVNNSAPGIIGTGGNITLALNGGLTTRAAGLLNLVVNNSAGRIQTGGNISSTIGGALTANSVNAQIDNRLNGFIGTGAGLTFTVNGTLTTANDADFEILNSQLGTTGGTIGSDAIIKVTLADANIGNDLNAFVDNSDGKIGGAGGTVTLQINGKLAVTGRIDVWGTLTSTGTLTAGQLSGTNVNAPSISVGNGGITRFTIPNEVTVPVLHTITTNALTSTGGINFNGPDFGTPAGFGPFDGGQLTINVPSLTFGSTAADNIQRAVTFNGGSSSNNAIPGGSGGTFTVNTTGAITVGLPIQATSGLVPSGAAPSGSGGTVNLNSTGGPITVNSAITVSSADAAGAAAAPLRRSQSGGNINLQSNSAAGVAINVSSTGQLLSLLDAAAPGPGGKITILATGANSAITATGAAPSPGGVAPDSIRADRGSIDIRHTGLNGTISLANSNILADIVKVGALGDNGVLTIGGGVISADTVLKLYAVGANGAVNFVSNVTLNGNSVKTIAGNTVTVQNNVIVTIGGGKPADVYVLDPRGANYSNFNGGNNSTTGMFILSGGGPAPASGASTHLGVAPPAFGPPGGP